MLNRVLETRDIRWKAVLLVGPTGCGKTPLGELLEREGLWERRCLHFDFGEVLRTSTGEQTGRLTQREHELIDRLLGTGALLEDEHFPVARKLLVNFITERNAGEDKLVVLNGLPRHIGQARAMEAVVEIRALVSLECAPEVAWERVRTNTGGDRSERIDDTLEEVKQRLDIFRQRTVPLLEYYVVRGVRVLCVDVGVRTTAWDMRRVLEAQYSRMAL